MTATALTEIDDSVESSDAKKEAELRLLMRELGRVLVAYSGGVDSTYLAFVASDTLGENAIPIMAYSPSVSAHQREEAARHAAEAGFTFRTVETFELEDPRYAANPSNRCYFCKSELYGQLNKIAAEAGALHILDGTNFDDLADHRPGRDAAREAGVRSPLAELGFSKTEIRRRLKAHGLTASEKPASPCLSSRVAPGVPVSIARLSRIERAEELIRGEGFREFRVRMHGDLARIEIAPAEMVKALDVDLFRRLSEGLRGLGFGYVTLDLEGFRSGSMNTNVQIGTFGRNNANVELENVRDGKSDGR